MTQMYQEVLHAAMSLPVEERCQLVDEILGSLTVEEAMPLDEEWREIIRLRWQEYKEGRVQTIPWEEVRAKARERIRRHG